MYCVIVYVVLCGCSQNNHSETAMDTQNRRLFLPEMGFIRYYNIPANAMFSEWDSVGSGVGLYCLRVRVKQEKNTAKEMRSYNINAFKAVANVDTLYPMEVINEPSVDGLEEVYTIAYEVPAGKSITGFVYDKNVLPLVQ